MPVEFPTAYPEHDQNVLKGEFWGRGKALDVAREKYRANRGKAGSHHEIAYAFILCKAAGNLKSQVYHQPETLVSFLWLLEAWNLLWAYLYLWQARRLCRQAITDELTPGDINRACRVLYRPKDFQILAELENLLRDTLNHRAGLEPADKIGLQISLCRVTLERHPEQKVLHRALFKEIGSPDCLLHKEEALLDYYRFLAYWFRLRDNQGEADRYRELALSLARRKGWDDQVLKIEAEHNAPLFL